MASNPSQRSSSRRVRRPLVGATLVSPSSFPEMPRFVEAVIANNQRATQVPPLRKVYLPSTHNALQSPSFPPIMASGMNRLTLIAIFLFSTALLRAQTQPSTQPEDVTKPTLITLKL